MSKDLDLRRKAALANHFATRPDEVREAFHLGLVYFQACLAHDMPEGAPQEDQRWLKWLRDYESRTGLRVIEPA